MKLQLKEARKRAGFTQADAAKALGVTTVMVSLWESGKHEPSVTKAIAMCHLYGVKAEDVIFLPSETIKN